MKELSSTDNDQERLINTVSDLTKRLIQIEEIIKEQSSTVQLTDVALVSGSTNLTELSNKDAQILAKSFPNGESLSSGQDTFPQSYCRDMMTSLSMPGMKFIGEKGQSWLHSCLWIFIHIVALLVSYVLIKEEYDNWNNSPVVKTISNNLTYVNEIPFPAITVCLPGSVKHDYDYARDIDKCISCNISFDSDDCVFNKVCTYEELASLAIASLICPYTVPGLNMTAPWEMFTESVKESKIEGTVFPMYSKNVLPQCDVLLEQIRSINYELYQFPEETLYGCDGNNYLKFVSSFGMCFTMNGLGGVDIFKKNAVISSEEISSQDRHFYTNHGKMYRGRDFTLENMIYFNGDIKTIPTYISENHQIEISTLGRYNKESYTLCRAKEPDLKDAYFAIHNPVEVPFVFNSDFDLKYGEAKEVRIVPEMLVTERGLESYNPVERGCFYSYERELAMFKHYSEHNCKTECAANCSLQHCGCVPYYLPRHNSSVRVCLSDCFEASSCDRRACSCLPDCYSLTYGFEIIKKKGNKGRKGSVTINYKTTGFYPTLRVGLTNLAQFMAYCLGIVGVFNGFTVMMIFEVLYFCTIKLWDSVKFYFK